jgi:hypothetical protein
MKPNADASADFINDHDIDAVIEDARLNIVVLAEHVMFTVDQSLQINAFVLDEYERNGCSNFRLEPASKCQVLFLRAVTVAFSFLSSVRGCNPGLHSNYARMSDRFNKPYTI